MKLYFLLILFFPFSIQIGLSCSCSAEHSFCETTKYISHHHPDNFVFLGKIIEILENGVKLEVMEDFGGEETKEIITIWNTRHLECMAEEFTNIPQPGSLDDTLFIIVNKITAANRDQSPFVDADWYEIGDYRRWEQMCMKDFLKVRNGLVTDSKYEFFYQSGTLEANEMVNVLKNNTACPMLTATNPPVIPRFNVFPNPVDEILHLDVTLDNFQVYLYNYMGVLVDKYENITSISMNNLNTGVYFIKIKSDNNFIYDKKIIKE